MITHKQARDIVQELIYADHGDERGVPETTEEQRKAILAYIDQCEKQGQTIIAIDALLYGERPDARRLADEA